MTRVKYIFASFKRLTNLVPSLKTHPVPKCLIDGSFQHMEHGDKLTHAIYEWVSTGHNSDDETNDGQWFVKWSLVLYRILKSKFLREGTADWKITLDWLFRFNKTLDFENEDVVECHRNIDAIVEIGRSNLAQFEGWGDPTHNYDELNRFVAMD